MAKIITYVLLALTLAGTVTGAQLTVEHMKLGEICPMLGPIPACAIVFISYLIMFITTLLIGKSAHARLFYVGWIPVFLLASLGVIIEITGTHICPPGPLGVPKCFYSLGVAVLCLALFIVLRKNKAAMTS